MTVTVRTPELYTFDGIKQTLEYVAAHLVAVDESNAAANLAEVRHRPLTERVLKTIEAIASIE